MNIAYVMQNVGIDLSTDMGQATIPKYTIYGLKQKGHDIKLIRLNGRSVKVIENIHEHNKSYNIPLKYSGSRPFLFLESGIRRVQCGLKIPYFAFFDSFRFYEACLHHLINFDICHELHGLFSVGAVLACKKLNIPHILNIDADPIFELDVIGQPLRGFHAYVAKWAANLAYKLTTKIICVSDQSKSHLIENWKVDGEKITVLPNGVDNDLFGRIYNEQEIGIQLGLTSSPVVIFVGSFQLWHGLDILVESFYYLLLRFPQVKLVLVGDGPARSNVERKLNQLGIEDAVTITGVVSRKRAAQILSIADIATLPYPSLPKELWFSPLKLFEYMASGKAIIASRAGQIKDFIIDGHNGILVEPGNVTELTNAMITLLSNEKMREDLGQNAKNQAIEKHSWDKYINRLEQIYDDVLSI
jgi:glycosyltransferase involved in cell wall biosynthesis